MLWAPQDCFELLNGLLRGNVANQRLFREMGHAGALPGLLTQALARSAGTAAVQGEAEHAEVRSRREAP